MASTLTTLGATLRRHETLTIRPLTSGADGWVLWSFHRAQMRRVRRRHPQPWELATAGVTGLIPKVLRTGWCNVDGGFDRRGRLVAVLAWRPIGDDFVSGELLTVRADCYGRGYGRQMLDHLVTTAQATGATKIVGMVYDANAAAVRLVETLDAELGPAVPGKFRAVVIGVC